MNRQRHWKLLTAYSRCRGWWKCRITRTQEEKDAPILLKSSRIRRIARGSGVDEKDVKELLAQWNRSRKMMRGMKGDRSFRRKMKSMMDVDDMDLDLG